MTDRKPEVTAEHREAVCVAFNGDDGRTWDESRWIETGDPGGFLRHFERLAQALAAAEQRGLDLGRADAWIPVGDIPLAPGSYLGFDRFYNRVGECESDGKGRLHFVDSQKDDCDITHWQPLPAPPKVTP